MAAQDRAASHTFSQRSRRAVRDVEEQLQLKLVLQRDTISSPFRNRSLDLPGAAHPIAVEGAHAHAPSLIEAKGSRVVVGADDGDHLPLQVGQNVGEQADGLNLIRCNEAWEGGSIHEDGLAGNVYIF